MGWEVIFRLVALAALLAMLLLALACGVAEPVARVRSTLVPVMQALQTAVVPAPTAASPTASAPGGSESTPAEPPVPAVTGLFELAAGVASELSEGVASNLPSGLSSFDGWREVDLVSPQRAAVIRDLTWVSDGVVGVEIGMVDWLIWTAIDYGEVFDRVIWLDWLSDGVTTQEIRVLKHLYYLAASDVGLALWVAGEPFLETVEYADAPAVESLLKVQLLAPEQSDLVRALLLATGGVDRRLGADSCHDLAGGSFGPGWAGAFVRPVGGAGAYQAGRVGTVRNDAAGSGANGAGRWPHSGAGGEYRA